jgi:hypothetical protein
MGADFMKFEGSQLPHTMGLTLYQGRYFDSLLQEAKASQDAPRAASA